MKKVIVLELKTSTFLGCAFYKQIDFFIFNGLQLQILYY